MPENCVFCQIVTGTAPADILYKDEQVTVFKDRNPSAHVHLLLIPNRHIESLNQITEADGSLLGHLFTVARQIAEEQNISQSGYRVIVNTGPGAGQSVYHLHFHLLGGGRLPILTR